MMKNSIWVIFLVILVACGQQRQQAIEQAASITANLPSLSGFTHITTVTQSFEAPSVRQSCWLGRSYSIFGTSLLADEAINSYIPIVQGQGWRQSDPYDSESHIFFRGDGELIEIQTGNPGVDVEKQLDVTALQRVYPTILYIRADVTKCAE